ncbi:MAG: hypothetical protein ACI9BW_003566 [Gammaproteobacteria bacterium]|jgi:hypothetical protein
MSESETSSPPTGYWPLQAKEAEIRAEIIQWRQIAFAVNPIDDETVDFDDDSIEDKMVEHELLKNLGVAEEFAEPLSVLRYKFINTANPVYAIHAFVICQNAEIPPRPWVSDFFASKLGDWIASNGLKSLDQIFGLSGTGTQPAYAKALLSSLQEDLMVELCRLVGVFHITINEAAGAVSRRLQAKKWNTSGHPLIQRRNRTEENESGAESYSAASLARMYSDWSTFLRVPSVAEHQAKHWKSFTYDQKKELGNQYPEDVREKLRLDPDRSISDLKALLL